MYQFDSITIKVDFLENQPITEYDSTSNLEIANCHLESVSCLILLIILLCNFKLFKILGV